VTAGDAPRTIVHLVASILSRVCFSLRVENARAVPRRGPCVVAANHAGYLDPVLLQMGTPRPLRYLVTSDFFDVRFARPFFRLAGSIRVPESGLARETLRAAQAVLEHGGAVGIFPEGQLTRTGVTGPFRPGAAFLAARARAPVVPAFIEGSFRVWPRGCRFPRQAEVRIRFGTPISLSDPRDDRRIREAVLGLAALRDAPHSGSDS
jgi:1-acyl-sn-glycerol-3-phosphate acyltransferase